MATFATIAEVAVVHVVAVMATAAGTGDQHFFVHRIFVAGVAFIRRFFMRPGQFEIRLIVVEVPRLPIARVVAILTLGTEATLMHFPVFPLMARPAIRLGILECRRGMTLLALHQHVTPQQRELGLGMIEGGLVPGFLNVTCLAIFALLAFMLIVLLVARETIALQFILVDIALMATRALGFGVLA